MFESAIDLFAMSKFQDQDSDSFVLYVADQAIIADAITPQSPFLAMQRFAPLARIICSHQPLAQKMLDRHLRVAVELCDLLGCGASNFNPPGQDAAPALRA